MHYYILYINDSGPQLIRFDTQADRQEWIDTGDWVGDYTMSIDSVGLIQDVKALL